MIRAKKEIIKNPTFQSMRSKQKPKKKRKNILETEQVIRAKKEIKIKKPTFQSMWSKQKPKKKKKNILETNDEQKKEIKIKPTSQSMRSKQKPKKKEKIY